MFPFPAIRPGQKEMLEDVREIINVGGTLIAHAPTGIGKTAAALAPALEYAVKNDKIVFFLTSKQSQHKIVIDTLKLIKNKKNVDFTAIDIISKQAMCPRGIAKEYYAVFNELCKIGQKTGECSYARNYNKDVTHYITENILHVEELKDICTSMGACPHKTASNAIANAHVAVCDYNYVFSDILETILDKTNRSLSDMILIIDEAHNLPDRIRNHLSRELSVNALREAAREVKSANAHVENKIIHNHLTKIIRSFNEFAKDVSGDEQNIEKRVIVNSINKVLSESLDPTDYDTFANTLKDASARIAENSEDGASYVMNVAEFLAGWNTDLPCSRIFSSSPPAFSLKLLDPSLISMDIITGVHAAVMMSGTLYPTEMYADILGAKKKKTMLREYESPFPKENRLIAVTKGLTTLYESRSESMYERMAEKISKIAGVVKNTVQGNTAVFFPSYALLNDVVKYFPEEMNERILTERRNMSKRQKNHLYNKLRKSSGRVLMGVQAGSLSEGLDYEDNMLKAVIIVGLQLSPPTLYVKNLKRYYADKFGGEKGMLYGYTYPAVSKVLQAAGRGIRSETDVGAIILMDFRFSLPRYMKCLPPDYDIKITEETERICEEFFRSEFVIDAMRKAQSVRGERMRKEADGDAVPDSIDENIPVSLQILGFIKDMDGKLGKNKIIGILRGSGAKWAVGYDKGGYFDKLDNFSRDDISIAFDRLLEEKYIVKGGDLMYPTISVTEKGQKAIIDGCGVKSVDGLIKPKKKGFGEKVSSTVDETAVLFREGHGFEEISKIRGLKTSTITEHLAKLIENNEIKANLDDFVKPEHQELIKNAVASAGDERLSNVKDMLPEDVSYDEIKITRAFLRRAKIKEDKGDNIALKIFGLMETLDFHAGRTLLANILIGSKSKKLIDQNIHKSEYYGALKEYTGKEVTGIIDRLIDKGYLAIKTSYSTGFPRPLLYLTELSKQASASKEKIELELPGKIKDQTTTKNQELVNKLKIWRKKVADEEKIPPYCVFHDRTLIEISNSLPVTKEGLAGTHGFGEKRIKQYGDAILEIVRAYKSKNDALSKLRY